VQQKKSKEVTNCAQAKTLCPITEQANTVNSSGMFFLNNTQPNIGLPPVYDIMSFFYKTEMEQL
jgi:hypothetical protein